MKKRKRMDEYVFMVMKKKDYEILMERLKGTYKKRGRKKGGKNISEEFENYLKKLTRKIENQF